MVLSKKIKIGSKVKVIAGQYKGKTTTVAKIFRAQERVMVFLSGINYKFNLGVSEDGRSKVQSEKQKPIDVSNVRLVK